MGIPCPTRILEENKKRKSRERIPVEVPDDELRKEAVAEGESEAMDRTRAKRNLPIIVVGDKARPGEKFRGVSMEEWEALLLEIARRSAANEVGMPPSHVPIPVGIAQTAWSMGYRGKLLALAIAAVAAATAVALMGVTANGLAVGIGNAMTSGRTQGRGGFHNNAAAALELMLEGGGILRDLHDGFRPGRLPGGGGPIL